MSASVAFALGVVAGLGIMGIFCDWMLAEAQSVLGKAKDLLEEAECLAGGTEEGVWASE